MIIDMLCELAENKNSMTKEQRIAYLKEYDYPELVAALDAKDDAEIKRLLCNASFCAFLETSDIVQHRIYSKEITVEYGNAATLANFANHLMRCDAVNSLEWI